MVECSVCKSLLSEDSEGGIAVELYNEVNGLWSDMHVGYTVDFGNHVAEVVKMRDSWNDSGTGDDYSYLHQGDIFDAYIIFKVGDFFFRKEGTGDSYGEVSWDGNYGPVQMRSKTVTAYEF